MSLMLLVPASIALWWIGGTSACGEETYDTPVGSAGDSLCRTIVHPVVPWAAIVVAPFVVAIVLGPVALRYRRRRLFAVAVAAPVVAVVGMAVADLAIF